jgi:5-formyltetrahydrofolate cyclo-ligase
MPFTKAEWRTEFRRRLAQLSSAPTLQQKVLQHLREFMHSQQGLWGAYQAMEHEIPLQTLISECPHIQWAFPCTQADGSIQFWQAGPQGFAKGTLGILEPVIPGGQFCPPDQFQGFIIPGLGFDEKNYRLGWGMGFYDRYLPLASGLKVGVGFAVQRVAQLPRDSWDVPMDLVITDQGLHKENLWKH